MLRQPITASSSVKPTTPKPPEMPRVRTLSESANTRRMAPYWLSGVEIAIDEEATRAAIDRGALSEEEVLGGVGVPQFSGTFVDEEGYEHEQICVLVGYLIWQDHEEYAATFGEDINMAVESLLRVEGVLVELQAQEIERYNKLQEMDKSLKSIEATYAEKLASGAPVEDLEDLSSQIDAAIMSMTTLKARDYAMDIGINLLPDGTIVLPGYGPVRRLQKIMDLMGFILSRHGRIVGVTDEWFNLKKSKTRGVVSPAVYKKCFKVEPITQDRVLELIMPGKFMQPLRVEQTVNGEKRFQKLDSKTPLLDILTLAQLYSLEEQENEMVKEKVVGADEIAKEAEGASNPL